LKGDDPAESGWRSPPETLSFWLDISRPQDLTPTQPRTSAFSPQPLSKRSFGFPWAR
jgi:hypothetical protein